MMLTLKPKTLENIRACAKPMGIPASTFVAQLLDEMGPYLQGMATAATAGKEQRIEALEKLSDEMSVLQSGAAQVQLGLNRAQRRLRKDGVKLPKAAKTAKGAAP